MNRSFPKHPRSAVSVLLCHRQPTKSTRYAVIKRSNPPHQNEWAMPGGAVELGISQLEQAQLEIEEELGLNRDQLLWCPNPLDCRDVIVKDNNKIKFHYTISQMYAELIGTNDMLIAGDDAANAIWWTKESNTGESIKLVDGTNDIIERVEKFVDSKINLVQLVAAKLPSKLPTKRMTEIKRKIDGTEHSFNLELWKWDKSSDNGSDHNEVIIGRWLAPKGGAYGMKEHSYSWGCWGRGIFDHMGFSAYRMHDCDGSIKGYRFDVCDVGVDLIEQNSQEENDASRESEYILKFNDLLLDGLVQRDVSTGCISLTLEDEDEVDLYSELLSTDQLNVINRAREVLKDPIELSRLVGKVDDAIAKAVSEYR
jgi:ADP-ribose pyrophosphatase YjhB (NUDIX family)